MKKRICIRIEDRMFFNCHLDSTVRQIIKKSNGISFNPIDAYIWGIEYDCSCGCLRIFLIHHEFDEVPEGCCCEEFSIEQAKKRFPYLFYNTNPLLYRRFNFLRRI